MSTSITRREFIQKSLSGAGLVIAVSITPFGYRIVNASNDEKASSGTFSPNVWVRITPDDLVTIVVNKSDMGQGVYTALPMIAADALDADWSRVRYEPAPAGRKYVDPVWGQELTGGSTSVRHMYEPLRQAGAAAREMLISAAARTWGVPEAQCTAEKGVVREKRGGRKLSYGQLADKASRLSVPHNPPLEKEQRFTLIGRPLARLDIPPKVHASAVYGMDVSVPGMVYADIARSPAYGADLKSYDKEAGRKTPGVYDVVEVEEGIAVTGSSIYSVWQGMKALNIKWGQGTQPELSSASLKKNFTDHLNQSGKTAHSTGDVAKALKGAAKTLEATYVLPYLSHMCMEPMNCTAHVQKDKCEIWVPTQNQSGTLSTAEHMTGLKADQITVHTTFLGGGFGRRAQTDFVKQALEVSQKTGRPVKLIWTREESVRHDYFRPGNCAQIKGGIDGGGNLVAWSHKVVCPPITMAQMKNGIAQSAVDGIANQYDYPNIEVVYVNIEEPIPTGYWRSVGNSQNGFIVESFMDELAHAANKDPLTFRLNLLKKNPSARRVLETVADRSGWGKSPDGGKTRGLAYHQSFGSHVAQVAEVSVDQKSGNITVHKVYCSVDCGQAVNPAIIVQQMKGGIAMGLSAALKEEVEFADGGVKSRNFFDYKILHLKETPEIDVHIVESKQKMGGIGEPGLPPIAAAVSNAVFTATGARVRELPLTPQRVKKALGGKA